MNIFKKVGELILVTKIYKKTKLLFLPKIKM